MNKKKNSYYFIFFLFTFCIIFLQGCKKKSDSISRTDFFFDTVVTITIYDSDKTSLLDECFSICNKYEKLFSKTISGSDISKINQNSKKGILKTKISNDTASIISSSLRYSKLTNGAFDITISPLADLWNIISDNPKVPSQNEISSCLQRIDYQKINVNASELTLGQNQEIDLGGIAKGYIADQIKNYLQKQNVKNALINLGGNVLEIGGKTTSSEFTIGIQYPFKETSDIIAKVKTKNKSIVSSGSYERYFKKNGKIYHHILDTSTGYPADSDLNGVTIISDSSLDGDGLSTSCFVLGSKKGKKLIESLQGIEAIFISKDNQISVTSGLSYDSSTQIITLK